MVFVSFGKDSTRNRAVDDAIDDAVDDQHEVNRSTKLSINWLKIHEHE